MTKSIITEVEEMINRLQRRGEMENTLREAIGGETFVLPLLTTEKTQEIRLRPGYEELLPEMYLSPDEFSFEFEHESLEYQLEDVEVREHGWGVRYRAKRAFGKTPFEAIVKLDLEFDEPIPRLQLHKDPLLEEIDIRTDYYAHKTDMTLWFRHVDGVHDALNQLGQFNWALSSQWNGPKTIEGLAKDTAKWEAFNQFQKNAR